MGPLCFYALYPLLCRHHKSLQLCGINQAAGMTDGWGNSSLIRLGGDAPCPHPQLLLQHLFTRWGLSAQKALLCLSKPSARAWRTRAHPTCTQRNPCAAFRAAWVVSEMYTFSDPQWPSLHFSLNCQRLRKKTSSSVGRLTHLTDRGEESQSIEWIGPFSLNSSLWTKEMVVFSVKMQWVLNDICWRSWKWVVRAKRSIAVSKRRNVPAKS